jgi:uncharacterized protein YndB with AHSA1/START domain
VSTTIAHPDAVETSVFADVEIAAPPEDVFRALTDPRELAEWWGGGETYRTDAWEVDARPGGEWSARTIDAAGTEGLVHGEYLVVDAPRRLEYTWRPSWEGFAPSRVRIDLAPVRVGGEAGTRVSVTHTSPARLTMRASASARAAAWTGVLAGLAEHLSLCGAGAGRGW